MLQDNTQVTINAAQSMSGKTHQFAIFAAKVLTQQTHGKQTTLFPVTQNHH